MTTENYMITYPRAPWWFPPYNGMWFDNIGSGIVTNLNSPLTIVSFNLDAQEQGVIRWFGQTVSPTNTDTQVTWQILINGNPDRVYGLITGSISSMIQPTETMIKLPKRSAVSLQVTTTNTSGITCIGRLKGWSWISEH